MTGIEQQDSPVAARPGGRELAAAFALCLAAALVWTLPMSLAPASRVVDGGDPLHLAWVMAWDAHQIVRDPSRLFESNTFYPYRGSLAFGDHLLPEALMVAPVFWATGNAVLASNVALILGLAFSGLAMYALVREVTGSRSAGAVGAVCYAFNSFTLNELARVQVMQLQWWPLGILGLVRLSRFPGSRHAFLFAWMMVLQGLSSSYYMVYSLLLAPVWWAGSWIAARRPLAAEVKQVAVALLLAAPVVVALALPYVAPESRTWREKDVGRGLDLLAYLTPNGSVVPGWPGPVNGFNAAFVGYATLLLALLGAWRWWRQGLDRPERVMAVVGVGAVVGGLVISLGPDLLVGGRVLAPAPYALLLAAVPFLKAMAGTGRAAVLVMLGCALLAGLAAAWLRTRLPLPLCRVVPAGAVVLLAAQHWVAPPPAPAVPTGDRVPAVYRWLAGGSGPVVDLPLLPAEDRRFWSSYLYFSTYHWRPIPLGRTSFYPPLHDLLVDALADFPSPESVMILQRTGLDTVVVHPHAWPDAQRSARLQALAATPGLELVQSFPGSAPPEHRWLGLGDERVVRVVPGGPPGPPPCTPQDPLPTGGFTLGGRRGLVPPGHPVTPRIVRERWRFDHAGDGHLRTSFATDEPQAAGDRLELTLTRPDRVAAITLHMGRRFTEFPRDLALITEDEEGRSRWPRWAEGPEERWQDVATFLDGKDARLTLRVVPRRLRHVVLILRGAPQPTLPAWSVAEVRLFRECR